MKTDFYTRLVLTGILLCLSWICVVLTPIGTPLTAQTPAAAPAAAVQDVRIVGVKQPEMTNPVGATLGRAAPRPVGDWDSLPTYSAPQTQPATVR
jgi:hypothetical protein